MRDFRNLCYVIVSGGLIATAILFSGCTASANDATAPTPDTTLVTNTTGQNPLVLNGSVTALPLMLALSDEFSKSKTDSAPFDVAATGKTTSLENLTSGESQLAVFEGSMEDIPAGAKGQPIAYEAVALVLNPSCNVDNLTKEQIKKIFTGEITDWSTLGGSGKITLILPVAEDSFRKFFEKTFTLNGSDNGIAQSKIPQTAVISDEPYTEVQKTAGAIGLCPAQSLKDLENTAKIDGVAPSPQSLKDGTYKASAVIMLVIGSGTSPDTDSFLSYCLSDQGKDAMKVAGYTPVE